MHNPSDYYSGMSGWVQQPPLTVGNGGAMGLRAWEMSNPGLRGAAGGLPFGNGDYAPMDVGAAAAGGGSIWDNFLTKGGNQGWGGMALNGAQGLLSAWMAMQQYGLAKDQLAEGKRQFGLNYDAQRTTTNSQLEDRQRARLASNPGAYQSVGDYMAKNGIKPLGG